MPGEHPCAVEDCTAPAKPGQLMCLAHWKGLPMVVQRRVNATWRRYRYEPEAYLEARGEAIAFWRGQATAEAQERLL